VRTFEAVATHAGNALVALCDGSVRPLGIRAIGEHHSLDSATLARNPLHIVTRSEGEGTRCVGFLAYASG